MRGLKTRFTACIIAAVLTLGPSRVFAEDVPCTNAFPVSIGTRAPCTGLLLPETQARSCLICLSVDIPKLQVDLHKVRLELDIRVKSYESLLGVERDRATRLQVLLEEAASIPGVVLGSVLTFGAIYAATELDN
jgi:hypothetical protein